MTSMRCDDNIHTVEDATIQLKRYQLNGTPTCSSWVGDDDNEREVCPFLTVGGFGMRFWCALDGGSVYLEDGILRVTNSCPLWEGDS